MSFFLEAWEGDVEPLTEADADDSSPNREGRPKANRRFNLEA